MDVCVQTKYKIFDLVQRVAHRHLSNIDCLTAHTICLVSFISTVNDHSKKKEKKAKNVALVVGT